MVPCEFLATHDVEVLEQIELDSLWNDGSACACLRCRWSGNVAQARRRQPAVVPAANPEHVARPEGASPALSAMALQQLHIRLQARLRDRQSRQDLEQLFVEIDRLTRLLEIVSRVSSNRAAADDDTLVS